MSTRAENFKSHGVWAQLETLGPAIDEALKRNEPTIDQRDGLERVRTALTYVGERLGAADPSLTLVSTLNNIAEALRQAAAHVAAFGSGGDDNQLANANVQLDSALNQCAVNVIVPMAVELKGLADQVSLYRLAMAKQLEGFAAKSAQHASELQAADARFKELQAVVAAEQQRVGSALNDWQTQFNGAQATREQQATTQTGTFQEQFSKAQEARSTAHTEAQNAQQTRFNTLVAEYDTKLREQSAAFSKDGEALAKGQTENLNALQEDYQARATGLLTTMQQQQADVDEILGIIGEKSVTIGHKQTADDAAESRKLWQRVTVSSLIVLVAIATWTLFGGGGLTLGAVAGRLYVSVALGVLAAYSASQGDRYHAVERYNRKLALELAALGPFLQPLPEEQREKFRMTVGERTFAQEEPQSGRQSPATAAHVLLKSKELKTVIEVVKTLMNNPK